ncbi:arylsulfatase [Allomuricauda sp. SCSIO 65647]|uniref:arylsulfatase n=1 Tax=Allomuricauda sp. SCSIO 65647 TaxID=2908843 RepID=UPI001F36D0D4|nr:arylsulfatase [Muricauda sp. SCSIO 65647]UJH67833.1 arylsulfatase [Muricauda sp. SCSIO 65647]
MKLRPLVFIFSLFFFSCQEVKKEFAESAERPNIVLILADDMGYSDLGCFGGEIPTPNIDSLAYGGLRFVQFYNTARCCPSRASLLTGLHPHQTGLGGMTGHITKYPGYQGEISNNCVTLAEALKLAGYKNYMTGKWHLTGRLKDSTNWPLQRGFDNFFGSINGGANFFHPNGLLMGNELIEAGENFYYTDEIAAQTNKFLTQHRNNNGNVPFFMYTAFTAPHFPLHAPDSSIAKFKGKFDEGWDVLRENRFERMNRLGITRTNHRLSQRDPEVPSWNDETNKEWELRRMEVYAAQIYHMDRAVGKIVANLKAMGVYENTLIMLLSDNGGCAENITMKWYNFVTDRFGGSYTRQGDSLLVSNDPKVMPGPERTFQSVGKSWANLQNTPFRKYKHYTLEGGMATPLIVHWPTRIKRSGKIVRQPFYLIDMMPTLLEVARAEYPHEYKGNNIIPAKGVSMVKALEGDKTSIARKMYWEHANNKAIREGNLKLVMTGSGVWELYDLNEDPVEENDLAHRFPEIVDKMEKEWNDWAWRARVYPKKGMEEHND